LSDTEDSVEKAKKEAELEFKRLRRKLKEVNLDSFRKIPSDSMPKSEG